MATFKLQKIDDSLLQEHSCLEPTDHCYFFGEYAGRQGYGHSEMNQLIYNFKKSMDRKGQPDWHYKQDSIKQVAHLLLSTPIWPKLKTCTWVLIPPSKSKSDPQYDDRLLRVLHEIKKTEGFLDIRDMLSTRTNRNANHNPDSKRMTAKEHLDNLKLDTALLKPVPRTIVIFDDVITSGASFKAAQSVLRKHFPETPIGGAL